MQKNYHHINEIKISMHINVVISMNDAFIIIIIIIIIIMLIIDLFRIKD